MPQGSNLDQLIKEYGLFWNDYLTYEKGLEYF